MPDPEDFDLSDIGFALPVIHGSCAAVGNQQDPRPTLPPSMVMVTVHNHWQRTQLTMAIRPSAPMSALFKLYETRYNSHMAEFVVWYGRHRVSGTDTPASVRSTIPQRDVAC